MNITLISGTNRQGSKTLLLTKNIEQKLIEAGVQTHLLDLRTLPSSLLSPTAYDEKPAEFTAFEDAVLQSDGLYIVAPEYNGGFPGVLKLFIDMLPFPESFEARPVAFVGLASGQFGNRRGIEQLQMVFGYRNAHIFPKRIFLPRVSKELNEDGSLIDPKQNVRLQTQVDGFIDFVQHLKA